MNRYNERNIENCNGEVKVKVEEDEPMDVPVGGEDGRHGFDRFDVNVKSEKMTGDYEVAGYE